MQQLRALHQEQMMVKTEKLSMTEKKPDLPKLRNQRASMQTTAPTTQIKVMVNNIEANEKAIGDEDN